MLAISQCGTDAADVIDTLVSRMLVIRHSLLWVWHFASSIPTGWVFSVHQAVHFRIVATADKRQACSAFFNKQWRHREVKCQHTCKHLYKQPKQTYCSGKWNHIVFKYCWTYFLSDHQCVCSVSAATQLLLYANPDTCNTLQHPMCNALQ